MPAGTQVSATLAGTVSFVGSIPSGDSLVSGSAAVRTMQGVSVKLSSGATITYMPFAQVSVKRGQEVAEGQALGTLAARGDRSSTKPHLHMGYKVNGRYKDPMLLFSAAASSKLPLEEESGATASSRLSLSGASDAAADSVLPLSGGAVSAKQSSTEAERATASTGDSATDPSPSSISSGDAAWAPAQPAATDPLSALASLGAAAYALVGALAAGGLAAMALHWGRSFPAKAAHRLNSFLIRVKGGGIVNRLFPASGSTFISRSR